jgi:hypothetical protein
MNVRLMGDHDLVRIRFEPHFGRGGFREWLAHQPNEQAQSFLLYNLGVLSAGEASNP